MNNEGVVDRMPLRGDARETIMGSSESGVSWPAIIGGAFVAASTALILTVLGVGLGMSSISPWAGAGVSAAAIGGAAIAWLVLTQVIASSLGGYLAGRLRVKWASVHTDEVYFRDTAHGFIVWAVGVVITVALLASALSSAVSTTAKVAGTAAAAAGTVAAGAAATAAPAASNANPDGPAAGTGAARYLSDSLLRADHPVTAPTPQLRGELAGIMAEGVRAGTLPAADRTYMAQTVAAQTGLSQADAEARVDALYARAKTAAADAVAKAKEAADEARSAAAKTSLWIFVALLAGAFCASFAAMLGGRERDRVVGSPRHAPI